MTEPGIAPDNSDKLRKHDPQEVASPAHEPSGYHTEAWAETPRQEPYTESYSAHQAPPGYPPVSQGYPSQQVNQSQYAPSNLYAPQGQWQGGYQFQGPPEAKQKSDLSMILGLIGLFFMPIILGPFGLYYAKQAEDLGGEAQAGKILGWVNVGLGIISVLFLGLFFFLFLLGFSEAASVNYDRGSSL